VSAEEAMRPTTPPKAGAHRADLPGVAVAGAHHGPPASVWRIFAWKELDGGGGATGTTCPSLPAPRPTVGWTGSRTPRGWPASAAVPLEHPPTIAGRESDGGPMRRDVQAGENGPCPGPVL